jgi:hypothetical protein
MNLDLTDDETAALLRELDNIIENDRFFLSPRIQTLKVIRAKLKPYPVREPLPPVKASSRREHQRPEATRGPLALLPPRCTGSHAAAGGSPSAPSLR